MFKTKKMEGTPYCINFLSKQLFHLNFHKKKPFLVT